ncbi:MAG TPA: hypothetical protein VH165_06325 [Kofleriaceae bacterium]|jgi:hypothetical protein|nr:hypothetical protein [Kofleriaceae bacterium]
MRRIACLVACLRIATGCHRSSDGPTAAPPDPYRSDMENLCDAVNRSGAAQMPASDRPLAIASWLGSHLQTEDAHQYLVKIQPLQGEAKAAALEAEARRIGLPGCALAAEWRTPAAATSSPAP